MSRDFDINVNLLWLIISDQTERVDRELNVVKRARFNQTIETNKSNEVPESKFGVEPHTVKELPALPVRERQQDNVLLHQQIQDNMLEEEVVALASGNGHNNNKINNNFNLGNITYLITPFTRNRL